MSILAYRKTSDNFFITEKYETWFLLHDRIETTLVTSVDLTAVQYINYLYKATSSLSILTWPLLGSLAFLRTIARISKLISQSWYKRGVGRPHFCVIVAFKYRKILSFIN